jgi:RNA polymerase sigma-54 factor
VKAALGTQIRQSQSQTLSPAMWMGLNMLAMPVGELKEAVRKEIETNPAIVETVPVGRFSAGRSSTDPSILENVADSSEETLEEHLLGELRMSDIVGRERELCGHIIGELDANGRFTGSVPDLVMVTGASAAQIENARRMVMKLDPVGCGAKDLEECLLAQIGRVPAAKREFFLSEMKNLSSGRVAPAMLPILKSLDPFPGKLYSPRKTEYVNPDIIVDEDGDVEVDTRDVPEISLSPRYAAMARDKSLDEETRSYAAERLRRARDFLAALEKRKLTMESIARIAVEGQREFLEKGASALVRQTMGDVAKKAKCNIATVSRAAARKYVKTPRGTFPLRAFFRRTDQAPLVKLGEILESGEGAKLSDREISVLMGEAGFPMARRTVAKYRAKLGAFRFKNR